MSNVDCYISQVGYSATGTVSVHLSTGEHLQLDYDRWTSLQLEKEVPLSEDHYTELLEQSTFWKIRKKALDYLAVREHSRRELVNKLKNKFKEDHLIEQCLHELQEKDLQSDMRYTHAFIRSRVSNKICGPFMILAETQNKGISREMAKSVLEEYDDQELWLEKARKYLLRVTRNSPQHQTNILWNKLYQRGFSPEIIQQILTEGGKEV